MLLGGRGTRYSPFERNVPASRATCYHISSSLNMGLKCSFYYQLSLLQIDLAQDKDQWKALVNTVMNLRVQ
jgi:hypothetical protein